MADAVTNFAAIQNDAPNVYIARQMFRLAERRLQLGKFAKEHELPQRMGKTLRVVRYKRLALPLTTLTEGTPPDAVALATENVDVTVEQWGIVVLLTDVGLITTAHPALQIAIDRSAMAMTELMEREIARVLLGGSNVVFPGAVASRAGLGASNKLDSNTIISAVVSVRNRGAADFDGGLLGGVIPPQMEGDMLAADTTFREVSQFANVRRFDYGEIGVYQGVRWVRGNFLPIFKGVAAPGVQAALVAGYGNEAGAGGGIGGAKVTVVGRDANSDYERIISQEKAVTAGKDTADVTTPTSTNYVWDIYMTDTGGNNYKRVFTRVAANTVKTLSAAAYAAGVVASPPAAPASGVEVFVAWVFGREAFGRVVLNGMSLQSYLTPAGASWSNPLAQGRKCGSKIMWKCFVLDNDFFTRIEAASAFSAGLPA